MNSLSFGKLRIPAADLNGESSLPSIASMTNIQQKMNSMLDEDDGLYLGYGFISNIFPYRQQNVYGRSLKEKEFDTAILENENLKAVFIPTLGGRLWSLFDKINSKELLYSNPVFRPGNLALRNAWFSGGVEWNIGMVGHTPFTCSPLFVATLESDDGTPVLRMYEYERIRNVTYQMDFFLPEHSRLLYCRMRIVNPNEDTVPMYWWSNIAVPEIPDGRVVVPADDAYSNNNNVIIKKTVPISEGIDITYPMNSPHANDYFWKIKPDARKYVCQINQDGYGLIQASTKSLKGRKLFVWGQGPGGKRWQEFLSQDGTGGNYVEIQAGLAHTQYECLPMPPNTAWEWMEVYGALQAAPANIHGEWKDARAEVETKLNDLVTAEALEKLLAETKDSIALKAAQTVISRGSGWGALENLRRAAGKQKPISPHLDFGEIGAEQILWFDLLQNGSIRNYDPDDVPISWINQDEFVGLLEKAVDGADEFNWYTWMHLGMVYFNRNRVEDAKRAFATSMGLRQNCWALYGLARVAKAEKNNEKAAILAMKASEMKPTDPSLAKEALAMLMDAKLYKKALKLIAACNEDIQALGRVRLYKAFSLAWTGELGGAEKLTYENGGLIVPDVREGENSVTDLWYLVEGKKAEKLGQVFHADTVNPPAFLDFRMNVDKRD